MRTLITIVLVFSISGCATLQRLVCALSNDEALCLKCQEDVASGIYPDSYQCKLAHKDPVLWRCSQNNAAEEKINECIEEGRFCEKGLAVGEFKNSDECRLAYTDPVAWNCSKSGGTREEIDKCIWAHENPIEAKCENAAQKHGGYWECIKLEYAREANERETEIRAKIHAQNQRLREEQEARERKVRMLNAISDAFKPPPRTRCVTRRTWNGSIETECEGSH